MSKGVMVPLARCAMEHGSGDNPPQPNSLARELVSDSRVLIEHSRLLVRNSNSRIDRIENRLEAFIAAIEAAEAVGGPAGKRLSATIARGLDGRDAA